MKIYRTSVSEYIAKRLSSKSFTDSIMSFDVGFGVLDEPQNISIFAGVIHELPEKWRNQKPPLCKGRWVCEATRRGFKWIENIIAK